MPKNSQQNFLGIADVIEKTSLSRSSIYRYLAEKKFPAAYKLGTRKNVWLESEIDNWISDVIKDN